MGNVQKVDCILYKKMSQDIPLREEDIRLYGNVIREQLKFMVRNNILLSPTNYGRWFFIFCHIVEKGLKLSDGELIDLYIKLYGEEGKKHLFGDLHNIVDVIQEVARDMQSLMEESKSYAQRKEEELKALNLLETGVERLEETVSQLINHLGDLRRKNELLIKEVEEQKQVIEDLKQRLKSLEQEANLDYLTNVYNRRSVERALRELFDDFLKQERVFSVLIVDLNYLKRINDTYGHNVGDRVLANVAYAIRSSLRAKDILGRWGGDEFLVLLPGADMEVARKVKERIKERVKELTIFVDSESLKMSVSVGVAQVNKSHSKAEDLIEEADKDMYKDKERP